MTDESDAATNIGFNYNSSEAVTGFDLFEKGVDFLTKLGVEQDAVYKFPPVVVTTIGSLLNQVDGYIAEVDAAKDQLGLAQITIRRLRSQRDALRAVMQQAGVDPMANYASGGNPVITDPPKE